MYARSKHQVVISMDFDFQVARAVMAVKAVERALHDVGPWFFGIGPVVALATKVVGVADVAFVADIAGPLDADEIILWCGNDIVGARVEAVTLREGEVLTLRWGFSVEVVGV